MNNPDMRAFDEALAECIDALKNGAKVEECLSRYPHFSERLEPYLRIAVRVDEGLLRDQASLSAATRASVMDRIQQKLAARQQHLTGHAMSGSRFGRAFGWVRSPRFAVAAVALAILIVLGGVTVSVAQPSVPGETLYPVKRVAENVRLLLTFDSTARAELLLSYAERRSTEIHDLLARGLPVAPELLADLRLTLTSALAEMAFVDGETRNRLLERAIALTETQANFLSTAAQNSDQGQSSEFIQAAEAMQDLGDRAKEAQKDPKVLLTIEPSPTGTRAITPAGSVSSPTPGQSQESQTPTLAPFRTPTPGGEPKPSATSPSPTHEEETETPSRTPEPSNSGGLTNTPRPTQTPNPSNTPQTENTPQPTKTPDPSNLTLPTQTRQPTQTPNSGNTPQPTKTPDPTETPHS
jgi:hypothetical protein